MRRFVAVWMPVVAVALATGVPAPAQQQTSSSTQLGTTGQQGGGQGLMSAEDAAALYRQTTGNERFLRENRDPGQMVGTPVTGVGTMRGSADATGPGGGRQTGGANRFGGFGQFNQFGNQFRNAFGSQYSSRQPLRFPVRLGFTPTAQPSPTAIRGRVQSRLQRIPAVRDMGSVSVQMDGSTAVLTGRVATADNRDLIARILLLEPGVSDVRNDLHVASTALGLP